MNSSELWRERFFSYSNEMQKYLKYIFNGHLVFVMIIALGGLGYYYSEWVKQLSSDFPAALLTAAVLGILLTRSPIATFVKEADIVFLLPVETKMNPYFSRSILMSLAMQSFQLLIVFAAAMPMYSKVTGTGLEGFFIILILLVMIKLINLFCRWYVLKMQDISVVRVDMLLRLVLNIVLMYVILADVNKIFTIVVFVFLCAAMLYYQKVTAQKPLKWERLIELEGKRMMAFYRIANLFTDVPKLRGKVARRKWLDWLLAFIPYQSSSSYSYLYARTMLRTNDYVGLLVRLTVIGSIVMFAFSSIWAAVFIAALFLYMTGIQLLPVWKQHELKIWVDLYPLPAKLRKAAVVRLVSLFLGVEGLIFVIVMLIAGRFLSAGGAAAGTLVLILLFQPYMKKKIML